MTYIDKLSSIAYNSIIGGLQGYEATQNISLVQLKDELIQTRMTILQKYAIQNRLPYKDLYLSIDCIDVTCKPIGECCGEVYSEPLPHFEIPQIFVGGGDESIQYIGTIDKSKKFKVYTSPQLFRFHKYKTMGSNKPYVYLDMTPNKNNKIDGYIFNAPLLEKISVSAIFKDPRDLEDYLCCDYDFENLQNLNFIDTEAIDTVVNKYLKYYRQLYPQPQQNNQAPQ